MLTVQSNPDGSPLSTDSDQAYYQDKPVGVTANKELVTVPRRPSWTDGLVSESAAAAVSVFAANTSRVYLFIQNISDTEIWVGVGATATTDTPSIKIAAGASWEPRLAPTQAISVHCTAASKKFVAKEA